MLTTIVFEAKIHYYLSLYRHRSLHTESELFKIKFYWYEQKKLITLYISVNIKHDYFDKCKSFEVVYT